MSKFQIILLSVFTFFIVAGTIAFSMYKGGDNSTVSLPSIEIWGTFSSATFNEYVNSINNGLAKSLSINYIQKTKDNFNTDYVEALARGGGPDAILVTQDILPKNEDKVLTIPFTTLPERTFKDTYVPEAELYISSSGILALPFAIDPMVMYWNREMFNSAGIANYPKLWGEFITLAPKINVKDSNSNIRKSIVALGEFRNITNAREILGTLFLQAGNPVTERIDGQVTSVFGSDKYSNQASDVINFFTSFADSNKTFYSWNRSITNSKNYFIAGNLGTYFGFASEINDLKQKNPNLDFDIAPMPQASTNSKKAVYADMYGLSISRNAKNPGATYSVLQYLVDPIYQDKLQTISYLPSVRRDIITKGSTDQYMSIFNQSALIAKGWFDPNSKLTSKIFQSIIESIVSGKESNIEALRRGNDELTSLFMK